MGLLLGARSVASQAPTSSTRVAEGRVLRPAENARPTPVPNQWVVLHRVGTDRAAPLDSTRSGRDGRFRFRYSPSGAPDALYFVSARYEGITYFSPPLRANVVRGGDADVMVYGTTSDSTVLQLQGRHLVLSGPRGARREVIEVFEIENRGTRTVVARDSVTPLFSTLLPARAESATVAPGDVGAGAVVFRGGRAEVYAPMSPGVRQLVLTYVLPAKAFPVSHPLGRAVGMLEVLLEDPRASVEGARLAETAPATVEGRTFRRFMAQDVPAKAIIRLTAPAPSAQNRAAMQVLAIVVGLAMLAAIVAWFTTRRTTRSPSDGRRRASDIERVISELAALDARFEREAHSERARAAYETQRAALKERAARALAAERQPE